MKKSYTYLLIGSNKGNREKTLEEALVLISEKIGPVIDRSPVYESEPWGFRAETSFLNMVLCVQTRLVPYSVLHECLMIEERLGRVRNEGPGYSSRTIDIDILLYENMIINESDLVIPHPRMHLRKFTLIPLNEIAGDLVHPVLHKTVRQLLQECDDPGRVDLYES